MVGVVGLMHLAADDLAAVQIESAGELYRDLLAGLGALDFEAALGMDAGQVRDKYDTSTRLVQDEYETGPKAEGRPSSGEGRPPRRKRRGRRWP